MINQNFDSFESALSWANEANAMIEKFQVKFKKLHGQINILQKRNTELENKLLYFGENYAARLNSGTLYRFVLYNFRNKIIKIGYVLHFSFFILVL